jgi:HPt (histidine-containing phosphotransfer) domain-containing protein
MVAMTASVLAAHRHASAEAGMDGFAGKPVDWYALSHEIARVLGIGPGAAPIAAVGERQVLNRSAGLQRWGGREQPYAAALAHFAGQYRDLAQTLQDRAAADDAATLRMLAHKVRGVAANLGLEQLADAMAQLEQQAERGDVPALGATLAQAAGALAAALAAAHSDGAPDHDQLATSDGGFDPERALRAGAALLQALRRGALDDGALASLATAVAGRPDAARVTQVQAALADFDFELAQQQLEAVLAALGDANAQDAS